MRLSIRAHDLGVNGLDNVIDRLNTFCLDGAQMVAYKVIPEARYEKGGITEELARQINSAFTKANKQVVLIGAYFNPIHSNVDKAQRGKDVFKDYLAMSSIIGCNVVASETGSYNDDLWTYNIRNRTDYALNKVVETFSELADYGQGYDASVGIEGAYGHVCYCVERLNEAIKSINKSNTKVVFDLYNYLSCDNFEQRYQILGNGLKLFENNIVAYHLKDCIVDGNKLVRCSVGKGIFDYERILSAIYEVDSNASLVLEGTCGEDIANSVEFIRKIMSKIETNNNKSNKE